ncbi:DEAD/DEAH box helicase [Vreelandella jeotgali]|uniref:DEAD/DEAH box helicase n=1 Tax=Vreelandella jeotgali TaxID=553386 RepID=UPI00034AA408|nr:DEAD/DEAH box helicase family protein [Halomonas jeotgali]
MSQQLDQATAFDLPPLRRWQTECLQQALQTLSPQTPHFLCQATPGAGKMYFAASLANVLLEQDVIDYVLYLGPTRAVVSSAVASLEEVTDLSMNGQLGASGAGFTYHALKNRLNDLMRLGQQARILLIWDESHHAAGHEGNPAAGNEWGRALMALERHVLYTVALSGTPWRSDGSCMPLLRYLEVDDSRHEKKNATSSTPPEQHELQPDFVYTLRDAIADGVCRYPQVELVDNRSITLKGVHLKTGRPETHRFSHIPGLLRHPAVHYARLVHDDALIDRLLTLGCQRLAAVRQQHPDAAGLVVAADIQHAEGIAQQLEERGHDVCLVTSREPNAHAKLQRFREGTKPWIVSVGMVSEGVDIPRLHVCCYLSHIRTETFFRQVLGRIIRRTHQHDTTCYWYGLNEPLLRHHARRLSDDLPEDLARVTADTPSDSQQGTNTSAPGMASPDTPPDNATSSAEGPGTTLDSSDVSLTFSGHSTASTHQTDVAFSRDFFERLVALRLTD